MVVVLYLFVCRDVVALESGNSHTYSTCPWMNEEKSVRFFRLFFPSTTTDKNVFFCATGLMHSRHTHNTCFSLSHIVVVVYAFPNNNAKMAIRTYIPFSI
mmetsp:Transcript_12042/g.27866  ORF Transcript_12042/g.27866 Transcript_12042/m.27866 type:complete len:100 (+) Transcript_12042:135-434(+)